MTLLFQIISALILILIINSFGRTSRGFGYVNMSDILGEGSLGFNLIFRILSPSIFISILSIILYKLEASNLIENIWLITLWYVIINFVLLLILNRWSFVNKPLYFLTHVLAIIISYWFYSVALGRGLVYILPEGDNFRTEIWIIIIIYFYTILNNYYPGYSRFHRSRSNTLNKKFNYFKRKYNHLLLSEFKGNTFLNKLLFSIMILEDINRSKFIRIVEKLLFPLGLIKSTGIMQIQSLDFLTDEESIKLAQGKILQAYKKFQGETTEEYDLTRMICVDYNDMKYFDNIVSIFHEIKFS